MSGIAKKCWSKLNYYQRLLGTGSGFLLLFVGGMILSVTVFPAIRLCCFGHQERSVKATRYSIHFLFKAYLRVLRFLGVMRFEIKGFEHFKHNRGTLLVANHPSLLDVVLLIAHLPSAQCIVKHQLWDSRYLGGVVRAAGYIRNDGDPELMLKQCKDALDKGETIIIFPEGTRSVPGKPVKFQRGFANIAALAQADISLLTINCYPPTLTKGEPWYQIPPQAPKFDVSVNNYLKISDYTDNASRSLAVRRLTRELEQFYNEWLHQNDPARA